MISRLGLAISKIFHKTCPDPFVIAIGLTVITFILAMAFGDFPAASNSIRDRTETLLDAWRADGGIWKLLTFSMQMCLILVTGHALASTRPIKWLIRKLADRPRSGSGAAAVVCICACVAGLINWGLGLIVGAELAREVGRSLRRRNISFHYPVIAAAGYMGLLVFHGGLSGSAPLSATTVEGAKKILPESAWSLIGDGIGLDRTLFSPLNFFVTGGLLVILPVLFGLLTPSRPEDCQSMDSVLGRNNERVMPESSAPQEACESPDGDARQTIPDKLDRSPAIACMLALLLLIAVARYVQVNGLWNIQINEVNALMFGLGLVLHGSPRAYMAAVEDGARDCAGIIVQFPIYAGIMALIAAANLVPWVAQKFSDIGDAQTLPPLMFFAATLVGLFVPSGGAQWGLQGEIALKSGATAGVDPGVMLMSVAYGDELANMLQPFWALPLLAITGVRARDIVGYTAVAMVVAGAWMTIGLWVF